MFRHLWCILCICLIGSGASKVAMAILWTTVILFILSTHSELNEVRVGQSMSPTFYFIDPKLLKKNLFHFLMSHMIPTTTLPCILDWCEKKTKIWCSNDIFTAHILAANHWDEIRLLAVSGLGKPILSIIIKGIEVSK